MRIGSNERVLGSLVILSVLAVSSLIAVPLVRAQSATTIPSTPALNSLTLTDYSGNDQSGISDLVAGKIQAYDFAVTPTEASTIPSSGFNQYEAPAAWYGLEINPTNTANGFNPFQFQAVRFALNYLVGRDYFVGNLLGGNGIATYSVFGGEPDELITSAATAPFSNITDSIPIANSSIYSSLIANGATFKYASTPQWWYDSKPIIVSIFDRTDDPVRHAYDGYLASQLEAVGFQVNLIAGTLAVAETSVYGTDPVNATWDIYPASYGSTYSYYDEGFAELYGPVAGAIPASSSQGLSFGTYNDTAAEQPSTVALLNTADKYTLDFFNTNFTSFAQRDSDLSALVNAGVKASVVIGLAQSLAPYAASSSLNGVTANFLQDPLLNALSFLTMNTASGSANIGVRHIAASSLNPVGGYKDSYSVTWTEATQWPYEFYQPATGYAYPVGWTFQVKSDSPTSSVPVPTSAVVMNASKDSFVNVAAGTMAKTDVVVNFAGMLGESWQDNQPLTMADLIYQYMLAGEVTQNSNSSVYDGNAAAVYGFSWSTVLGFSLVNSTSIELYTTFYYPDAYYAGASVGGSLLAFTVSNSGAGMLPWQEYAGMANLVSSGKDAWSTAAATQKNLPWLSLVNPADVSNLKSALSTYASSSYIPPEFASLQQLTGVTLVTPAQAAAGYTSAVNFINKYGTGIVGNGPFILTDYSASTSPAFITLTKNPAFTWGNTILPQAGVPPVILSQEATIPGIINPGQSITVTALQTPDGSKSTSPAPDATVTLQLISNGAVAYQTNTTSDASGQASFVIPASLSPGPYIISVWTATPSSALYNPLVQSVELSAASATSTSSSSSSPSTSTTSSTSTTTTTTPTTTATTTSTSTSSSVALSPAVFGGMAIVTIVVVAALVLGSSRRRGLPLPSVRSPSK